MREVMHDRVDIGGAREEIFNLIQRDRNNNINIYFDGWGGIGAAVVLRSIEQVLPSMKDPPPKLCFGRIIYIDCSSWTSKRAMQKVIAKQLRLENETMAMFDEQDEEDDFNGVDLASRDEIRSVAAVIDKTLRGSRFMMIFINGSDEEEVVLGTLGIPEHSGCVILWTFSASLMTMRTNAHQDVIKKKLRYTDVFLWNYYPTYLTSSEIIVLLNEEASNIVARYPCMRGMDLARVVDCCLYGLLLTYHSSRSTTGFPWLARARNFWICDGIMPGDRAREISNALHREIRFMCEASLLDDVLKMLNRDPKTPFLIVNRRTVVAVAAYEMRPHCRWLSVPFLWNKTKMQTTLAGVSSIFLAFENKHNLVELPNRFFKQCSNLGVLVLSCCAFSFFSPPFLRCHTLRFLGLDHCTNDNTVMELEGGANYDETSGWALFLYSVRVIDLYYTNWAEILSEEKIELMANLMELNIEGVRWPRWTSNNQIHKRLSNLQHLRIIRPTYEAAEAGTRAIIGDSFLLMDNTSLEILDLSGSNRVMGSISSKAGHLQVIVLDGCDGLGDVMLPNNSSLRLFSFDGYGPAAASHRTSNFELPPEISRPKKPPTNADMKKGAVKTSIVSLRGCGRLDKLFLRGLPNLVELDLSGCAIMALDFGSMVVDVPALKRLFLIGCERLHVIRWGSDDQMARKLQMICIDTRPGSGRVPRCARPPSLGDGQKEALGMQVHAIIRDARLARSLYAPIFHASFPYYFNIRITSTATCSNNIGAVLEPTATADKETIIVGSSSDQQRQVDCYVEGGLLMYGDVITKVGDGPAPMQAFPQAPTQQSDRHMEIGDGSRSMQSEIDANAFAPNLAGLMCNHTESVHVHDVSTCSRTMPAHYFYLLKWCRVERCPNLHAIFPLGAVNSSGRLETIWASDLLKARCAWSKGGVAKYPKHLEGLCHLHLRCCPSLRFALAMTSTRPSFPSLETMHIIHCGDLRHVFEPDDEKSQHTSSIEFPKLTTIHLHDLPALQQICEGAKMVAPALETIKIRGCWRLRRLPALKGREAGTKKPTVEVEKDVWDALEWDGVDVGHHPSLYEAPVHSHFYKRRMLRRTILR